MLTNNKIETSGNNSQSAINTGGGDNIQIQINYGLMLGKATNNDTPLIHDPENQARIRLGDLVGPRSPIIEDQQFSDIDILGPCIVYLIAGVHIENCKWENVPGALFIEIPDDQQTLSGVIGLKHCEFKQCVFKNIAILAKTSDMAKIKSGFTE